MTNAVAHYPLCRAIARLRCPKTMDYRDAVQDAMVGLLEAPDTVRPSVVVTRRVIDSIRANPVVGGERSGPRFNPVREDIDGDGRCFYRRLPGVLVGGAEWAAIPLAPDELAGGESMSTQAASVLVDAVATLPPDERDVIYMHHTQGMTFEVIGESLGKSPSRISQIHSKACKRLRKRLHPLKFHDLCPS